MHFQHFYTKISLPLSVLIAIFQVDLGLFTYLIQLQYKLNIHGNHIVEQYNQSKNKKANK